MSEIPASLAPFFQEYDLEQLTLERSATTIIERTLQYGNREEIRWLFSQYSRQRIREWVQKYGNHIFNFLSITIVPDQKISTLVVKSNSGINGFVSYVVEPNGIWTNGGIADARI